jgi:transposase InsO family protein
MGNLPAERVAPTRAFLSCGIDFAGPFMIKTSMRRNAPLVKGYVCIFVCFSTKAVHIELVGDLSTTAFINALNRFFDRRGRSVTIFTDNATNFVGANRKMKEWSDLFHSEQHKKKVQEALTDVGVQWRFIPPRSPHFGGLWEAAVKSMKHLLQKTVGNANLHFEELNTVLTRAEACLNSRPITPMSSDPNDTSVLTPGHFLIGDSLLSIPEPDLSNIPTSHLTRWRRVAQYSQIVWKKWSREYLNQLQERKRWAGAKGPKLEVDTVVLLREDNIPPLRWRLGRVTKIVTGGDGEVRVAEVRTSTRHVTRAVRQLCPLPFEGNNVD